MSGDLVSSPGERQGNLALSAIALSPAAQARIARGIDMSSVATVRRLRAFIVEAQRWAVEYRCHRLVAEIGPWMLAERKRKAST